MDPLFEELLSLLRCSLNKQQPKETHLTYEQWEKIYWLARAHGLVAMVNDAIEMLPEDQKPTGNIALSWILSAERTQFHFQHQSEVLASIQQKAREHGIQLVIIKGMSLARFYPKPNSRSCGDIDIYFPGYYKFGNQLLGSPEAEVDGKHAEMKVDGVVVENHLHFLDQHYISQRRAERYIKSTLKDTTPEGYLSSMGNLVYLLMHTVCHLTAKDKLPLRNVIDWGMFMKANHDDLDPTECHRVMKHVGMNDAFNMFTLLAGEFIGYDLSAYLKGENIIQDDVVRMRELITSKKYMPPVPKGLSPIQWLKVRYSRNRQRRWLYRYLPSTAVERVTNNIIRLFYKG
ncbi:MAG: nucleotidyltransferase family protein [Bacteroidales bacterium]|nr:nucleotidyltransferase family protein [Candidatus Colimorpha merdihippi]